MFLRQADRSFIILRKSGAAGYQKVLLVNPMLWRSIEQTASQLQVNYFLAM
jgi:hypothetical protein